MDWQGLRLSGVGEWVLGWGRVKQASKEHDEGLMAFFSLRDIQSLTPNHIAVPPGIRGVPCVGELLPWLIPHPRLAGSLLDVK